MNALVFSFKRLLAAPRFALFLLLVLLMPCLAQRAAADVAAPAPVFAADGKEDADASRIASYLEEAGFVRLPDEAAVRSAVASGRADAGVIIPGEASQALTTGQLSGLLRFIKSPNSLLPDLWQEHAAAALFTVYAPYIMADALDGSGISEEESSAEYYKSLEAEKLFRFEILTEKGRLNAANDRQSRFFLGMLSLLLFTAVYYGAAEPLITEARALSARIGRKRAVQSLLLPGALIRGGLLYLSAAGAALLCGWPSLLLPLLCYIPLLFVFGLLLELLPGRSWQGLFCLLLLLASLALCPIYTDLSLIVPVLAKVRLFLPTYWLWMIAG